MLTIRRGESNGVTCGRSWGLYELMHDGGRCKIARETDSNETAVGGTLHCFVAIVWRLLTIAL